MILYPEQDRETFEIKNGKILVGSTCDMVRNDLILLNDDLWHIIIFRTD